MPFCSENKFVPYFTVIYAKQRVQNAIKRQQKTHPNTNAIRILSSMVQKKLCTKHTQYIIYIEWKWYNELQQQGYMVVTHVCKSLDNFSDINAKYINKL